MPGCGAARKPLRARHLGFQAGGTARNWECLPMTKVSKAGQCETKETQRNGKSIKIALKSAKAAPFLRYY